jgi:DNA adenine methylase
MGRGKYKLSPIIESHLPSKIINSKEIKRYIEPFFGGGGFYFYLNNNGYNIEKSIIIDKNPKLINLYKTISYDLPQFISRLNELTKIFLSIENEEDKKKFYYEARKDFNTSLNDLEVSVLFMFLNKTCFNGLYRENSSGDFNVPMGSYKKHNFYDEENIQEVSNYLKNCDIICGDFDSVEIEEGGFFYLDPPYIPLNKTSNFTSYTKEGFSLDLNKRLINFLNKIDSKGAKFILSNSYSEKTLKLYKDFNVFSVEVNRSINSKSDKRNKVKEIIVKNFL